MNKKVVKKRVNSKLIVCDWNRTLYDPEEGKLYSDALVFLDTLTARGSRVVIVSVREDNAPARQAKEAIRDLVADFLENTKKTPDLFYQLQEKYPAEEYWAIGDKIDSEIAAAKQAGWRTIRVRRGKFADQVAQNEWETAEFEVSNFTEALLLLV